MTDWLNSGYQEESASGGDDFGGYLDLDSPPMPDAAPAPPSAPPAGDGYLGGGYDSGGYGYEQQQYAEPSGGYVDESAYEAPADPTGSYFDDPLGGVATAAPPAQYAEAPAMTAAPTNPAMSELSVQAPYLDEVHPSPRSIGGGRTDISELVLDVEVQVEVCFGDAALTVEEFLEMGRGSVVELDHAIDAPIELKVKGRLVARGQLVTINGNYGMRITEMLGEGRG